MEYSQIKIDLQTFFDKFDSFSKTVFQEIDQIKVKLDKLEKIHSANNILDDGSTKEAVYKDKNSQRDQTGATDFVEQTSIQNIEEENKDKKDLTKKCVEETTKKPKFDSQISKLDQKKADGFKRLVEEKFSSFLIKELHQTHLKVIAGLVMTRGSQSETISVAMGTKCIFGACLSWDGGALNDMHAEVIARRCFISYLYDQLNLIAVGNEESSIFILREDKKGYRVKDGIRFHLFISVPPCGDSTIPNSTVECLRTKIEGIEGTFPAEDAVVQTRKKISKGHKLKRMSCSDKICRWNVLGLQGALLSHFVEPIYLESITIGSQMDLKNLQRATYGRIAEALQNDLSLPYRLNCPSVFTSFSKNKKQSGEAPNFCINWSLGKYKPEVIVTRNGLPKLFGNSKYCKWEFLKKFVNLKNKISSLTDVENSEFTYYYEIKEAAVSYKKTKETLYEAFKKAGLGNWVSKPQEQDVFEK